MRNYLMLLVCLFLAANSAHRQTKKYVIAVIGSSTAQGVGATPIDSSWVNLTKFYFQGLGEIDTIYNVALGGETTYAGMPSDFVQPAGRPAPDTATNVTKALSFNPDVVLVNFPTNDAAADYTLQETMSNLRVIYQSIVAAGKTAYITTSQPRTSLSTAQQELLKTMRDSVQVEFGAKSLDFYDPIVASDSLNINPIYNFDGTHVNNAGHQQLFQVVRNAGILPASPLPLTLLNFTATPEGRAVTLHWTVADETGPMSFVIQRSKDATDFEDLAQETLAQQPAAADTASWTDDNPLTGKSYYRLKYGDNTTSAYSRIVSVDLTAGGWGIGKLTTVTGAAGMQAEIFSATAQTGTITVFNASGQLVFRQEVALSAPSVIVTIPTSGWAGGQYFLHVVSNQGDVATKGFMKF